MEVPILFFWGFLFNIINRIGFYTVENKELKTTAEEVNEWLEERKYADQRFMRHLATSVEYQEKCIKRQIRYESIKSEAKELIYFLATLPIIPILVIIDRIKRKE